MAEINEGANKGTDFKERIASELSSLIENIKETVIDAIGIGWIFDNGLSKIRDVIVWLFLFWLRWMIKLTIFILVTYWIVASLWPHGAAKLW